MFSLLVFGHQRLHQFTFLQADCRKVEVERLTKERDEFENGRQAQLSEIETLQTEVIAMS